MNQDYPAPSAEPVCSRPVDAMNTDYRAELQELHAAIQLYTGQNPAAFALPADGIVRRLMDAMSASAAALAQLQAPEPTDEESVPLSPRVVTDSQIRSNLALWARLAKSLDLLASAAAEHEVFSARLDDLAGLAVWACDDRDYRDALEVQP